MKLEKITDNNKIYGLVALLIGFALLSRLAPHPPNVAPIAAVALFGGALLPRRWALSLPLLAMVVSDYFIGFHSLIAFTWGSFFLIALLSHVRLKHLTALSVAGSSLVSSVLFFLVTNFGVWFEGRLYDRSFAGLAQCYYNALPFFRNTLLGDLLYCGLLFGAYALVASVLKVPQNLARSEAN